MLLRVFSFFNFVFFLNIFTHLGKHFWLAFSNGEDMYKNKHEVITELSHDVTAVKGSNELYSFRGTKIATSASNTIERKFMHCYCSSCRSNLPCPSRSEFGRWDEVVQHAVQQGERRRTRAMHDAIQCVGCEGTGDPT